MGRGVTYFMFSVPQSSIANEQKCLRGVCSRPKLGAENAHTTKAEWVGAQELHLTSYMVDNRLLIG